MDGINLFVRDDEIRVSRVMAGLDEIVLTGQRPLAQSSEGWVVGGVPAAAVSVSLSTVKFTQCVFLNRQLATGGA
jgi:hypothetical protein